MKMIEIKFWTSSRLDRQEQFYYSLSIPMHFNRNHELIIMLIEKYYTLKTMSRLYIDLKHGSLLDQWLSLFSVCRLSLLVQFFCTLLNIVWSFFQLNHLKVTLYPFIFSHTSERCHHIHQCISSFTRRGATVGWRRHSEERWKCGRDIYESKKQRFSSNLQI